MRRGAGSLKVNDVLDSVPYTFIFTGNTISDAKKFVEENLVRIFKDFKKYAGEKYNPQTNPDFAVLSENHARISLTNQSFGIWENGFRKISNEYQQFRRGKKLDHRYTFGLPITTHRRFRDLRQASPLFIGVMDLNGIYAIRLVKFYTSIYPAFSQKLGFLRRDLNSFDIIIARNRDLGEIEIKLPEVDNYTEEPLEKRLEKALKKKAKT
jgi:hypothetical protein